MCGWQVADIFADGYWKNDAEKIIINKLKIITLIVIRNCVYIKVHESNCAIEYKKL